MGLLRSLAFGLLVLLNSAIWATATDYTVGDTAGWTIGVDYTKWASDKTFQVGDKLIFNFVSGTHSVTEVTQSAYKSCSSANAISNSNSGPTTVPLTSVGTHYFICGVPGHCSAGQKLAAAVGNSAINATPINTTSPTYVGASSSVGLVPVWSTVLIIAGLAMLKLGSFSA